MPLETPSCFYKILSTLFILCVCAGPVPADEPVTLTLLNWDDYIDPELLVRYETMNNVRIRQISFASDDDRTRMLLTARGGEFDVAVVDGDSLEGYSRRGWLYPLTKEEMPNLRHLDQKWVSAYPAAEQFAVPYFWGTTGIVYRSDLVPQPISSWHDLFVPGPSLKGKIYMLPQNRELIDIALKAAHHSINSENEQDYSDARQLLLNQKPFVSRYDHPALNDESALLKGDIVAAASYSGDALMLQDLDDRIHYATPVEGGVLWVDYLVILAASTQKLEAAKFINFLNDPDNNAQLTLWVHNATPNLEAEKRLPQEFLNNSAIYPPKSVLERYEIDSNLPAHIHKLRSTIFAEVTAGKL